ncbi:MAG: diguanylate cyclase domain-containing protein [Bulleidia sp.]
MIRLNSELKQILDESMFGIYIADSERRIVYWNKEAERISGRSREEMVGKYCYESGLDHIDHEGQRLCTSLCPYLKTYQDGKERSEKVFLRHKNGNRVLINTKFIPVFDEHHQLEFVLEEFSEIGSQQVADQVVSQLSDVAQHDQLTGIPNRRFLDDALAYRVLLRKEMGKQHAVLFMDVDNFGKFNNLYGHEAGDLVLKKLAGTITSVTRRNDIFGRWGGEEFMGIYEIQDPGFIPAIGQKCLEAVRNMDVVFEGQHLHVTASIGITCIRETDTPETVTERADTLMYHSKTSGKDQCTSD